MIPPRVLKEAPPPPLVPEPDEFATSPASDDPSEWRS